MLLVNLLTLFYFDMILDNDISVYVIQVGRYKEKVNVDNCLKKMNDLGFEAYWYENNDYFVVEKIYLDINKANKQAKAICQKGITCVVKEYLVSSSCQSYLENKKYQEVFPKLVNE